MPSAEIVAIGSELLLGQIVDTNSAWLAQRLTTLGIDLFHKTVVGDNPERMRDVIARALERSDVVITGGGIGPTQDDITREVVAEVTGRKLVLVPALLEHIEKRFRRRGFIMTSNNERQAYIPEGATAIDNPNGTAPSFVVEEPGGVIFALPGVPFELKWLFDNEVAPYLRRRFDLSEVIAYRVLKVADMGESMVDDLIGHLIAGSSNPTVGVLAHPGQVDIRIAAKAPSDEDASVLIGPIEKEVRGLLGRHVFAVDDQSMEDAVGRLLREKNTTIAVYEDVSGGLVAESLMLASPEHFLEGTVGSGDRSIRRLLAHTRGPNNEDGLPKDPATLATELARAARLQAGADLGLALHGLPEPSETAENLARGRTFISITDGNGVETRTYNYSGRGRPDRTRTSLNAMELVRLALLDGLT
jgi:nicotinamide-nucleotide amidase